MSSRSNDRFDAFSVGGLGAGNKDGRPTGLEEIAAAFDDLDSNGAAILRGVAARVGEDLTGFGAGVAPVLRDDSMPVRAEVPSADAPLDLPRPAKPQLELIQGPWTQEQNVEPASLASRAASGWAGWLKRAAVLAPAGTVKLATTGGGNAAVGAKGVSTVLVGGSMVVLAATVVAVVGVLASTLRLAGGGSAADQGTGGNTGGDGVTEKKPSPFAFLDRDHPYSKSIYLWLTWIGYAFVLVLSGGVGTRVVLQATLGLVLLVGTAATIWVAHAAREATFEGLGRTLSSFLGGIGTMVLVGGGLGSARLVEVYAPMLLVLVSFSIGTVLKVRENPDTQRSARSKLGALALGLGAMGWLLSQSTFGTTVEELVEYVNDFDESPEELLEWEELGPIARAIGPDGLAQVDKGRLRGLLGEDLGELHPCTVHGALALGLFSRDDLGRLAGEYWEDSRLFARFGGAFLDDFHAAVLAAQLDGGLDKEQRFSLNAELVDCWPHFTAHGALERAANVLRIAEAGGLTDFGASRAVEIRRLLENRFVDSWGPFQANGFSSSESPESASALTYVGHGWVDDSVAAVELMGHLKRYDPVGFEELDVDVKSLARFLTQEAAIRRVGTFLHEAPPAAAALISLRVLVGDRADDPLCQGIRWIYFAGILVALGLVLGALVSARRGERALYGPE